MILLFKYNWKIRDEWFELCRGLSHEELIRERTGGVGSILKTFFHVIDVECSWIQGMRGEPVSDPKYEDYMSLDLVENLSYDFRIQIIDYLNNWTLDMDYQEVKVPWMNEKFYCGEVLRHIAAHEIHHVGQLSIWAKELGIKPISANFIGRGLM